MIMNWLIWLIWLPEIPQSQSNGVQIGRRSGTLSETTWGQLLRPQELFEILSMVQKKCFMTHTRLHSMEDWEAAELTKVKIIIWDHNRPLVCDDEHFAAPEKNWPSKPETAAKATACSDLKFSIVSELVCYSLEEKTLLWSVRMLDCMALLSKARASCCGLCWWECSKVPNPKMTVIPKSIWSLWTFVTRPWQNYDKIWQALLPLLLQDAASLFAGLIWRCPFLTVPQHVTACFTKIHLGPWLPLVQSSADNLEGPHTTRHTIHLPGMETDDLRLGRKAMKLNSRPGSWNLVLCWLEISYHCQHGCSVLLPTSVANRVLQRR